MTADADPGDADGPGDGGADDSVYQTLFAASPDALVVVDSSGRIALANSAAAALFGYPLDRLVGMAVDALVPDAIRPRHAEYRSAFGQAPRARPMGTKSGLVARRSDGTEVEVEIALSPLRDSGQPLVVAAVRDVGAYPRVKQALQRAHYSQQLAQVGRLAIDARNPQAVLDQVPRVAARAMELDVCVVYLLEPSALQLRVVGIDGEMPGESAGDLVANRADTLLGAVLSSSRSVSSADCALETRFVVPTAHLDAGLVSALVVPLLDQGRTIGAMALHTRRSRVFSADEVGFAESLGNLLASSLQRARSEEALNHSQRLESIGQLTGGIAHDFNNLLTVIQGNLQVLAETPGLLDDALARQLVDSAARASRRGAELTAKLLAFARRQVLQPKAVDVAVVLRSLADLLRRTLDQRISIVVETTGTSLTVLADPAQLESALLNIAINSRDAMPDGGTLSFSAQVCGALPAKAMTDGGDGAAGGDFVAITIADDGCGMAPDVKERAVEPFFTTKEAGRGTGLGLSTVYGFARQSRGAVLLESELGRGTTVTLYVPRPRDAVAPGDAAESERSLPAGLSVLLVEDDAEVRAVVRRLLESLDAVVTEAASGEEALREIESGPPPDVLLSDIGLGAGARGTEVARRARERLPGLAVVLMSGYSSELLAADGGLAADWELLRKPCSREALRAALARAGGADRR